MSKLINKLKQNKGLTLVLSAFLLLIIVFIYDASRLAQKKVSDLQDPYSTRDKVSPPVTVKTVSIISTNPDTGVVHELDTFQPVEFYFSAPVNVDSADIAIVPRIRFNVAGASEDPTKLVILPQESWEPKIRYIILIRSILGQDEEILNAPYKHIYENVPPDTTKMKFPY